MTRPIDEAIKKFCGVSYCTWPNCKCHLGTVFKAASDVFFADTPVNFGNMAKAVATERQHGCHYAEGTCSDCAAIARAALAALRQRFGDEG